MRLPGHRRCAGLFERAHQGTLLLYEIGEMPLVLQAKLLRILQEREFERIGGHQTIRVDIRIVAATNRCLQTMVKGRNVSRRSVLPAQRYPSDFASLTRASGRHCFISEPFFYKNSALKISEILSRSTRRRCRFSPPAPPGNIRELSNVIERAVVMNTGAVIFADDLPDPFRNPVNAMTETKPTYSGERNLKEEIKREEKRIILEVLDNQDGNRTCTALMLGISRRALMYKLQEYGIDPSGS